MNFSLGNIMKLQQLRYIWEVSQNDLNVSATALSLYTSQPGISKQIRLLEDELGIEIFARSGKHLTRVTLEGQKILKIAGEILDKVENIKQLSRDYKSPDRGSFSIATTQTQARYVLPSLIKRFLNRYPDVSLNMIQGTPAHISEEAMVGSVDLAIAYEDLELFSDLVLMPCYRWNRRILVPPGHPLAENSSISLEDLVTHPIVTYPFGISGRSKRKQAFKRNNLEPKIVFTATDADVIKTYVRLGLGVGIVAEMAFDGVCDLDIVSIDASNLFESSITSIGIRQGTYLRSYMFDFIEKFAPHLTREVVKDVMLLNSREKQNDFFNVVKIPDYSSVL
jgi:LysR family cys regulon transcriptional activator